MGIEKVAKDLGLELSELEIEGALEALKRIRNIEVYGRNGLDQKARGIREVCSDLELGKQRESGYTKFMQEWYSQEKSIFDYIRRSSPWPRRSQES